MIVFDYLTSYKVNMDKYTYVKQFSVLLCSHSFSSSLTSIYSRKLFSVRRHGISSPVNRETLLELSSELRSDALPVTILDFSKIQTHDKQCKNHVL